MFLPNIDELRRRGLEDEALFPDDDIISAWERVWVFIEEFTEQFFEPRTLTLTLDGSGDETQYLPIPIISLTSVAVDGDPVTDATVYNRQFPDDRRSPKLMLESGSFTEGLQNVEVVGSFGFVEPGGTPPKVLVEAANKLLVHIGLQPLVGDAEYNLSLDPNRLIMQRTETYLYKLSASGFTSNGPTGIPSIDLILHRFRRGHWLVRGASV